MRLRTAISILLIMIIVFAAFYPCLKNGFVNWDDDKYLGQAAVSQNFSLSSLNQVFSSFTVGHYQPVTILSYMADYQLYKLAPFGYHLTNLLLHLANCLLVFWFIYLISRNTGVSFLTALLFGIHPLRVESVAWVSERKDVLYAFFYLLAIISYIYYAFKDKGTKFYLLSLGLFLLSLLSKSMAVTLPLVLLLLDYYLKRKPFKTALLDKIPYFILSLIMGFIFILCFIFVVGGPRQEIHYGFLSTVSLPAYGIVFYLGKLLLPIKLSAIYSYYYFQFNQVYFYSIATVILLMALAIFSLKYTKKVLFGALFFLLVIWPTLQFMPSSDIIVADRYTYLSSIGVFYIAAVFISWAYFKWRPNPVFKIGIISLSGLAILSLCLLSFSRCKVWKDGLTLWNDTLKNYPGIIAYNARGMIFVGEKDYQRAYQDFNQAAILCQKNSCRHFLDIAGNRANAEFALGRSKESIDSLNQLIKLKPDYIPSYLKLAAVYYSLGRHDQAIFVLKRAIEKNPDSASVYFALGNALMARGDKEIAQEAYRQAIEIDPQYRKVINKVSK